MTSRRPSTSVHDRSGDISTAFSRLATAFVAIGPALNSADWGVVAVLDMKRLGRFNAKHGRAAGDRLLAAVERSLRGHARETGGCVARLPGDQFIVVQPWATDPEGAALTIARAACVRVAVLRGGIARSSASVGVATWDDAQSRAGVVRAAARHLENTALGC